MKRLTTNKSVADMSMIELAHNSCYADDERNARYRDYEMEMDARDFARNLMVTLAKDKLPVDDAEFDEEVLDNLMVDPFSDVRGLIALFYRNLWAMADLREVLKCYEDAEEQGLLLRLPCKVGDTVWQIMISGMKIKEKKLLYGIYEATVTEVSVDFYRNLLISTITNDTKKCENKVTISAIGETIFLAREEAEAKLKELEEKDA